MPETAARLDGSAVVIGQPPRPGRATPDAVTAVLMPFTGAGDPDFDAWGRLVEASWAAGLTPAVNMDTGHVNILSPAQRGEALRRASALAAGRRFVAGVFSEGTADGLRDQQSQAAEITRAGGLPIVFPCSAMSGATGAALARWFARVGEAAPRFLGFELSGAFAPFGRIWDVETFAAVIDVPQLIGSKHSSLDRCEEWSRLALRDDRRPDFRVYTGNDLAIDMVEWGSDYLLGLSAFHVGAFAARDRLLGCGDPRWRTLNDWLQYLGMFAFRPPVPAYKHSCAQFLKLRGWLSDDAPAPGAPRRPDGDLDVLAQIRDRLDALVAAVQAR